jgi:hypothetical protein
MTPSKESSLQQPSLSVLQEIELDAQAERTVQARRSSLREREATLSEISHHDYLAAILSKNPICTVMMWSGRRHHGEVVLLGTDYLRLKTGRFGNTIINLAFVAGVAEGDVISSTPASSSLGAGQSLAAEIATLVEHPREVMCRIGSDPNGVTVKIIEVAQDFLRCTSSTFDAVITMPISALAECELLTTDR